MTEIIAADIGGTHARFALADVEGGQIIRLKQERTFRTAEHASLEAAWELYARDLGSRPPTSLGLAVAAPLDDELLKFTNNHWVIRSPMIASIFGVDRYTLINDFGAVAHAVAQLELSWFEHLCGPDDPLPKHGVISIIGPGTGLGVAILKWSGERYQIIETEGGHIDFAPLDELDDRILRRLRARYGHVSVERVVSGIGLRNIYDMLADSTDQSATFSEDSMLWTAAMQGDDRLAKAALDRFCHCLGAVAGSVALAHGASAVVLAGGLGQRLAGHLQRSTFTQSFSAKGRFERRMAATPVKLVTYPQPGLFGAATAFVQDHAVQGGFPLGDAR